MILLKKEKNYAFFTLFPYYYTALIKLNFWESMPNLKTKTIDKN